MENLKEKKYLRFSKSSFNLQSSLWTKRCTQIEERQKRSFSAMLHSLVFLTQAHRAHIQVRKETCFVSQIYPWKKKKKKRQWGGNTCFIEVSRTGRPFADLGKGVSEPSSNIQKVEQSNWKYNLKKVSLISSFTIRCWG